MKKSTLLLIYTVCLISFVALSWWLLFRDVRALSGFQALYPLFENQLNNFRTVLLGFSLNVLPTILFAFVGIISFATYFLLLKKNFLTKDVNKMAIIFQLIIFLSYPVLSTDIFSYVFSDRVATEYGQNKWLIAPNVYPNDKFEHFADWKEKTNVYGYVNHLIYLPANYLGNDDVFTTILLYKITAMIFAVACVIVLNILLADRVDKERSFYLKLILWNPLFLLEILGSAHNDIFLIFFLLLSILFWMKKNWLLAGAVIAVSLQIKIISIIYFLFFSLQLFQKKKTIVLFSYLMAFFIINIFSFIFMRVDPITFVSRVVYNTQSYWQSLPGLFSMYLPAINKLSTFSFFVFGLGLIFIQLKKKWNPIQSSIIAILGYLFFFNGAYWNWYVLWVLFFVPFIKNIYLRNLIVLLTLTSLLAYPLLWTSYRFGFGNPIWPIVTYLWIFGVPLGYLSYNYLQYNKGQK